MLVVSFTALGVQIPHFGLTQGFQDVRQCFYPSRYLQVLQTKKLDQSGVKFLNFFVDKSIRERYLYCPEVSVSLIHYLL